MRSVAGVRARNRISADQSLAEMSKVLFQHFMASQNLALEKMKVENQASGLEAEKVLRLKQLEIQAERTKLQGQIQRGELDLRKFSDARAAKQWDQEMDLREENLALSTKTANHGMMVQNMQVLMNAVEHNQSMRDRIEERYDGALDAKDLALDNAVSHYVMTTQDGQVSFNGRFLDMSMGGGFVYIDGSADKRMFLRTHIPGVDVPVPKWMATAINWIPGNQMKDIDSGFLPRLSGAKKTYERNNYFKVTRDDIKKVENGEADDETRERVLAYARYAEVGLKQGLTKLVKSGEEPTLGALMSASFGVVGDAIAKDIPKKHHLAKKDFETYFAYDEDSLYSTFQAEYKQYDKVRHEYRTKGPIYDTSASNLMKLMNTGAFKQEGFVERIQEVNSKLYDDIQSYDEMIAERDKVTSPKKFEPLPEVDLTETTDGEPISFDYDSAREEIESVHDEHLGVFEQAKMGLEIGLGLEGNAANMRDFIGQGVSFVKKLGEKLDGVMHQEESADPVKAASNREAALEASLKTLYGTILGTPGDGDLTLEFAKGVGQGINKSVPWGNISDPLKEGLGYINAQIASGPSHGPNSRGVEEKNRQEAIKAYTAQGRSLAFALGTPEQRYDDYQSMLRNIPVKKPVPLSDIDYGQGPPANANQDFTELAKQGIETAAGVFGGPAAETPVDASGMQTPTERFQEFFRALQI